jgi:GNAT superfamily N-acetyltransferase
MRRRDTGSALAKKPELSWVIERLAKSHQRSLFDCGQPLLDDWLKMRAGQFDRKDLARTFVAVLSGETHVRGYYALASHRVRFEALPADQAKGLPKIDVPVVLLGRLAVDQTMRGHGLGSLLVMDALKRARQISEQVGIRAVEVDAIDDQARGFYLKFDFVPLLDDPNHLFLPMRVIRKLDL